MSMHEQLLPLFILAGIFGLYTLWGIITYYKERK
jgi:hypothetical protein